MAIYHLSAQVIGRSAGRSSVAAAAYRAGERLEDERTGLVHDYGRRRDIEGWVQAPDQAPAWVYDRQALWNAVEAAERRHDAQLARELNVALPVELDREQQQGALWDYVAAHFIDRGMIADVALHHGDPHNPHAHIMLTMRELTPEGFGPKVRDWNDRALLRDWRERWEHHVNDALERAGRDARIDHRSLADQALDRLPTIHEGPTVREMEARGIATERGDWNRAAAEYNQLGPELAAAGHQLAEAQDAAAREDWIARRAADWERAGYSPAGARALASLEHDDHNRQPFRTLAEAKDAIDARSTQLHEEGEAIRGAQAGLSATRATLARVEAAARERERLAAESPLRKLFTGRERADAAAALTAAERDHQHAGGLEVAAIAERQATLDNRAAAHAQGREAFQPLAEARREIIAHEDAYRQAEQTRTRDRDTGDRGDWDR